MRTCTLCNSTSPDTASNCIRCGSDLAVSSTAAAALAKLRKNPRVTIIRVIASRDACPACRSVTGEFEKDKVPDLPVSGCSHPLGCRCFYEPALSVIYP